jgi:dynein heavy chain
MFSLIITVNILIGENKINPTYWRYLLSGYGGELKIPKNPTSYFDKNEWPVVYRELFGLQELDGPFAGILDYFMANPDKFKPMYDETEAQTVELPDQWQTNLNQFQRLFILKALRPDKFIQGSQLWIESMMGRAFVEPPTLDIAKCFEDSKTNLPLLFVLSTGSDPMEDFVRFAESVGMGGNKYSAISLGQGQGKKAEVMIRDAT